VVSLSERDVDLLIESGIRAMAGAPLSHQGTQYGVVILVVADHSRAWSEADLETIELTAAQASIALVSLPDLSPSERPTLSYESSRQPHSAAYQCA
jgi:hypothetical protein